MTFHEAVRELIDELNANAESGLITRRALTLINVVQRMLLEEEQRQ